VSTNSPTELDNDLDRLPCVVIGERAAEEIKAEHRLLEPASKHVS
jgi:hypothetical protein